MIRHRLLHRLLAAVLALAAAAALAPAARAQDPAPTIDTVTPASGLTTGGTEVTITGTGFAEPMSATFDGVPVTAITFVSATEIRVTAPPHARGAVDVVVTRGAPPPPSPSAPAAGAFTYVAPPARVWVPRAPGSATGGNPGGFDLAIVDAANRTVEASLDLNAGDAVLTTDDDWRVTQVLFDATGSFAYCATAGAPGKIDSRRVFVVKTARALGTEPGAPVVASIDTGGNPYQVALNAAGTRLFVADAGSWKASATILPNGTFRAYDVSDPAAPVAAGTPATVGVLPVLSWDSTAFRRWGTNSSFPGLVQSGNGRCVVANAGSHSLSVIDLATLGVVATQDVGVEDGGLIQLAVSIPSPYSGDFVFAQATDLASGGDTAYSIYRLSTDSLIPKGLVAVPMRFFQATPVPDLSNRQAWPHPDGQSLVVVPATGAHVVTFNAATGGAAARATIPGTEPPAALGFNDATGLFYARRKTGGWTVLSVPDERGAAPVVVLQVEDATGVNSLRVFGSGAELAGTATSSLAVVSGTTHLVVDTVALPLDPAGGAVHPQPGPAGAPARTFVTIAPSGAGPRIDLPLAGTEFCGDDDPPEFEFTAVGVGRFEVEFGDQPDFLRGPGAASVRVRVPAGETSVTPPRRAWRRVLRAAAGSGVRPLYARVNGVLPSGERVLGERITLGVCAPVLPIADAPSGEVSRDEPPLFEVDGGGPGRHWVEIVAPSDGAVVARWLVGTLGPGSGASISPSAAQWRDAIRRGEQHGADGDLEWRVLLVDALGRRLHSDAEPLSVAGP